MLEHVKVALRIKTNIFDEEIQTLIDDCLLELAGFGIYRKDEHLKMGIYDQQIQNAVVFYCKWKFGNNPDAERWADIYHDKVTKLLCMTGYGLPVETSSEV